MNWFTRTLNSTIGQKYLVAITGLGLVGFLITHLLGNLQIFAATETPGHYAAIDDYAEALHAVPGLALAEAGLLLFFLLHIALVFRLTMANRSARGDADYAVKRSKRKGGWFEALAGRTMAISGIVLLVFLVIHIAHFRLKRSAVHGPEATAQISTLIMDTLSNPVWAVLYIVGSLLVGFHLYHGFHSAFRSLGLNHRKYTPLIERIGFALAIILALGFVSIPLAVLLASAGLPVLPEALLGAAESTTP